MQSKAYAKAQGVPTTWSQEDQGYIARWYNYYSAESYYRSKEIGERIRIILFVVFVLLNFIILHITITYGTKWHNLYPKNLDAEKSSIFLAVGITSIIFNLSYLIYSVFAYPAIARLGMAECTAISDWKCRPSHNSSLYQIELAAFIVRLLVIFSAIIIHFVVVIKSSNETEQFTPNLCHHSKCYRVFHVILLWNTFVFIQIWVGLISLPAFILLLIAPLQTISALCATVLIVAFIAASILYLQHCGIDFKKIITCLTKTCIIRCVRNCGTKTCIIIRCVHFKILDKIIKCVHFKILDKIIKCVHFKISDEIITCLNLLWHSILVVLTGALAIGLGILYFNLLPQGGSLSIRTIFISLLPTVLLSLGSWVVRKKFFTGMKNQHEPDTETRQSPGDLDELAIV